MRLPVAISDLSPFTMMHGTDSLLIQDDAKRRGLSQPTPAHIPERGRATSCALPA